MTEANRLIVASAVLGVDIGLNGAIAMLDEDGELIAVEDMPCLDGGPAGRRAIDAPALAKIIRKTRAARANMWLRAPGKALQARSPSATAAASSPASWPPTAFLSRS